MSKVESLKAELVKLKAKQVRTGGSRKLQWEIDSVRHQIKCEQSKESK